MAQSLLFLVHNPFTWVLFTADQLSDMSGAQFSTVTYRNGKESGYNQVAVTHGPFWYTFGEHVVLTGVYGKNPYSGLGITWETPWSSGDYAKYAVMMIRPR